MIQILVRIILTGVMIAIYSSITFISIKGLVSFIPKAGTIIYFFGAGFEAGKLVVLIYIHRRWGSFNFLKKMYYLFVSVVLVSLTLVGMYLFITDSYSKSTVSVRSIKTELAGLKTEKEFLLKQINSVDFDLKALPANHVKNRFKNKDRSGYKEKEQRVSEILKRETELKKEKVKKEKEPLSTSKNSFEKWYILILVIAYEMLSIGLIFATSDVWQKDKTEDDENETFSQSADMENRPKTGRNEVQEIGRKSAETEPAKIGQNVESGVNKESANLNKSAEIKMAENQLNNKPAKIGQNAQNVKGKYLISFQKEYQLSAEQIADITERKKIKTVESWCENPDSIPDKAISKLKNWHLECKSQKLKLVQDV
ncbi:MAG: hypothetical protein GY714_10570 [Desulfobacterales bacterium]|nr:hypothetical protein [Desulfobacterales bacterium]